MSKLSALFIAIMITGCLAQAKFDPFLTQKLSLPQDVIRPPTALENVSKKVTNSLTEADNSRTIVSKVIDSSLAYWWDTSGIKNTSMGQAVETVEQKMKAEVNLGSTQAEDKSKATQHKLSFRVMAAQALAKIEYFGWFKGVVQYNARNAATEAEVFENLENNKDLVISHSVTSQESKSQVSLRWNW